MTEDMRDHDAHRLSRDWITVWQSELAALAADPELHDLWGRMVRLWASNARSATDAGLPREPGQRSGSDAPPRPAPAAATSAEPDAVEQLRQRVLTLEQRLEELERRV